MIRVGSVVYGEKGYAWAQWMKKSLGKVHGSLYELIWSCPNEEERNACPMTSRSAYWKSRLSQHAPIWILDSDLLVLSPLVWKPESSNAVLAAAPGGDKKYLEFVRAAGQPVQRDISINCGVMWLARDLRCEWQIHYERLEPVMAGSTYSIGETAWNSVWHNLAPYGQAELLPQSYNQIISEHGAHGAKVFHLAGAPEQFKAQLMESYFRHFFPEEV